MKKIKDVLIGLIIGVMISAIPIFAQPTISSIAVAWNSINVQLEGKPVEVNSILYEGSTYLPMRKIAELVGKDVEWISETKTANITESKKENVQVESMNIEIINGKEHYAADDINNLLTVAPKGYVLWPSGRAGSGEHILTLSLFVGKLGREEKRLIENVPYIMNRGRAYIEKAYYEQTILPLIK